MFTKHAEIEITRGTQGIGGSLRVGESPRVTTSIKRGGGRRGGDNRRVTRTDRIETRGGIRTTGVDFGQNRPLTADDIIRGGGGIRGV